MAISSTGRYKESTVANLAVNDLPRRVIVPGPQHAYSFGYQTYMWTSADRPDSIAQKFYGDSTAWWHIADANPEIMSWINIAPGTIVRIPSF